MEKIYHTNINQNNAEIAILISNWHYQENIPILNTHVANNRASKYIKQESIELEGEINKIKIIVRDFNTIINRLHEMAENH